MRFRKLSEIAPSGASPAKPAPDETVWHLTLDQIESGSGKIRRRSYGRASDAGTSTFVFDTGNVLYSKLRPYLNKVVCPDSSGIATTELVPLRPIPGELNREFLCFYLRSPEFVSWASAQVDGAKMPRMKMKSFWAHEIPLPPLDDQIRIARLLGKVEGLIAQRKKHLQQLDDLLKSVFLEMFGDPVRNEKGWTAAPLEQLGSINRGVSKHRPRNDPKLLGGPYPLIQTGEVSNAGTYITTYTQTYSELGFSQSKLWPAGTLCITIAANIAQVGILTFDACFPDSVVGFLAHEGESNTMYVLGLFWFFQAILEKNAPAAAQKNINLEILRALSVPKPPIELQNEFATIVEKVEALRSRHLQSLTDLEALCGALSQQAFKGELDLSRVALPAAPIEGERPVAAAVPEPSTTPVIELPETDLLLLALQDRAQLAPLLRFWLDAYRTQLGGAAFSAERFIAAVQNRLGELRPHNDFELRSSDYEHVKAWVFEALDSGLLRQERNQVYCVIETKETVLGNLIELRASQP